MSLGLKSVEDNANFQSQPRPLATAGIFCGDCYNGGMLTLAITVHNAEKFLAR